MAAVVFERLQSLSEKEFALGGPMDIGPNTTLRDLIPCLSDRVLHSTAARDTL